MILLIVGSHAAAEEPDVFQVETEGSYHMAPAESVAVAKAVAMFNARRKAVEIAGRYLVRKNLIPTYELNRDEIYSLAAREIRIEIREEDQNPVMNGSIYRIRIRAWVQASDFIKAELEDMREKENETRETFSEEMEQPIAVEIDPGKDIAKAYRLLREKKWRIAMIYMDHLEKKYPNWDRIYMAKAITYYILHEPVFMKRALSQACDLGLQIACDDLKHLKRVHEHDFGLSAID